MKKVLVDTDVLIDFLRGVKGADDYLREISRDANLYCSVITVAEIHAGMLEKEKGKTNAFLEGLFVLPVTQEVAENAGRFKREIKSHALELDDCLIAATAYLEKAVLVTKNRKHYPINELDIESPKYR